MEDLTISNENLNGEFTYIHTVVNTEGQIVDTVFIPVHISQEQPDPGKTTPIEYFIEQHINQENIDLYDILCFRIGKLNRLAEYNLDRLRTFIQKFFSHRDYEEYFSKNSESKKRLKYNTSDDFNRLSFGELKNILSYIIKNEDMFHKIETLDSVDKRNIFTKYYHQFIQNRDILTHGVIFLSIPDREILCRAIINNEVTFVKITEKSITDSHQVFHIVDGVIGEMLNLV